jgi:hypothetical protein
MNSYFVFGNFSSCKKDYGDFHIEILFQTPFDKNILFCDDVFSIFDFYYGSFGKPLDLKNYTVTLTNARSFAALDTGFFSMWQDTRFIAHEMFHLWQSVDYECNNSLVYLEGLTSFMEHFSRLEAGLINRSYFEEAFIQRKEYLTSQWNISGNYLFEDETLDEIRKKEPHFYDALVYFKGSLIWKKIYDSGENITVLFSDFLKTGNCSRISELVSESFRN